MHGNMIILLPRGAFRYTTFLTEDFVTNYRLGPGQNSLVLGQDYYRQSKLRPKGFELLLLYRWTLALYRPAHTRGVGHSPCPPTGTGHGRHCLWVCKGVNLPSKFNYVLIHKMIDSLTSY